MNTPVAQTNSTTAFSIFGLLECMRPVQWIKNGFVLAVLVFSSHLTEPVFIRQALLAFAAFCTVASGVYLWNDSLDWRQDRAHPEKMHRPIPSGRLSAGMAMMAGTVFLVSGILAGFLVNRPTGIIVTTYAMMNILYALWLKHMVILDVMCIALGFVFRVMAGASAVDVEPSHWLLMCTFLLALFLAVAKRRQEVVTLAANGSKHRKVLGDYVTPWLDQAGTILAGATIVAYALYTVAPETTTKFKTDHLIYTVPFVLYGILRYLHLVHSGSTSGNPTAALVADRPLIVCIAAWLVVCAAIIHG
jgi:4-hydroxybenzoate polyprenyltransferase